MEMDAAVGQVARDLDLLHVGGPVRTDIARRGSPGSGERLLAEWFPPHGVEGDVVGHQGKNLVEIPGRRSLQPGLDKIADRLFVVHDTLLWR